MALALYTTVYPGVEPYLRDWYESVLRQTDLDFQLWIALDGMGVEDASAAMGARPDAGWMHVASGRTPAEIRQQTLSEVVEHCDQVVLVDSDDVLHPTRVAAARDALATDDLVACALRLVDDRRGDLGLTLGLPPMTDPESVLPRHNVFGLSNSAFRGDLLRRCLPIPADAVAVDWFLATRAWLQGARLGFDRVVRMDYRQHCRNTARVLAPFSTRRVAEDTELVRRHFQLVRGAALPAVLDERLARLRDVAADIDLFYRRVVLEGTALDRYVSDLNALAPAPLWWSTVAYPALERMWR